MFRLRTTYLASLCLIVPWIVVGVICVAAIGSYFRGFTSENVVVSIDNKFWGTYESRSAVFWIGRGAILFEGSRKWARDRTVDYGQMYPFPPYHLKRQVFSFSTLLARSPVPMKPVSSSPQLDLLGIVFSRVTGVRDQVPSCPGSSSVSESAVMFDESAGRVTIGPVSEHYVEALVRIPLWLFCASDFCGVPDHSPVET